jgi:prepilin-type N-terminal cleavage/methylation domain-containing protein
MSGGVSVCPSVARRRPRGFTLIELAVVMFIMGLMLLIAMPYLSGIRSVRLRSESRRLAGRIAYLYDRASSDKVVLRLTFDLDGNRYSVSRLDPYAPQPVFALDTEPGFAPVLMPIGVRLRDVTVEGVGTLSRGTINSFFYPEGYVDATVVHLVDEWGTVFTLNVNSITGRVAITNGDLGPKPGMILPR